MALVITKTPVQAVEAPKISNKVTAKELTQTQALVNEMVQLESEFLQNDIHNKMKRFDEIKKHLSGLAKNFNVDEPTVFKGTDGEVEFSKTVMTTEVTDKDALIAKLGQETFNNVAKLGVTDARKYLSDIELESITTKVPGARKLVGVRKY